jgi:hypothetical protein
VPSLNDDDIRTLGTRGEVPGTGDDDDQDDQDDQDVDADDADADTTDPS